jgi:hypothetical protein
MTLDLPPFLPPAGIYEMQKVSRKRNVIEVVISEPPTPLPRNRIFDISERRSFIFYFAFWDV